MAVQEKVPATFLLPQDLVWFISDYAKRNNMDMNEALEQIIRSQHYFSHEIERGGKIIVRKRDGSLNELDFTSPQAKY